MMDENGKPAAVSEAGYRLYNEKSLERLWAILFFRELELPLSEIKTMLDDQNLDRKQILQMQKSLMEQKRNHLNGLIELIDDVLEGVNTMNFEPFDEEDALKIVNHSLELQNQKDIEAIIQKFGSLEAYKAHVSENLCDEATSAELIQIYGSKDKAVNASLASTGDIDGMRQIQDNIDQIYRQFAAAMQHNNYNHAEELVCLLAGQYKKLLHVDNARYVLLQMAEGYVAGDALAQVTDQQYGEGVCRFIGQAIQKYYGEE